MVFDAVMIILWRKLITLQQNKKSNDAHASSEI